MVKNVNVRYCWLQVRYCFYCSKEQKCALFLNFVKRTLCNVHIFLFWLAFNVPSHLQSNAKWLQLIWVCYWDLHMHFSDPLFCFTHLSKNMICFIFTICLLMKKRNLFQWPHFSQRQLSHFTCKSIKIHTKDSHTIYSNTDVSIT